MCACTFGGRGQLRKNIAKILVKVRALVFEFHTIISACLPHAFFFTYLRNKLCFSTILELKMLIIYLLIFFFRLFLSFNWIITEEFWIILLKFSYSLWKGLAISLINNPGSHHRKYSMILLTFLCEEMLASPGDWQLSTEAQMVPFQGSLS